jgi:O-methyltransferase involved in polyketide biosynthesis
MEAGRPSETAIVVAAMRAAHRLAAEDRAFFEEIRGGSASLGEPRRDSHDPEALRTAVEALGYPQVEDLSSEDYRALYFSGRSDGLRPFPQARLTRYQID